jgi:transcriptional regulator with XRE-family HTH domain
MFLEERKKAGKTQAEVAEAVGVTCSAVSQWESGKIKPRMLTCFKLADFYGCTVDDLVRGEYAEAETGAE